MLAGRLRRSADFAPYKSTHTFLAGNVRVPIFYRTQTFMLQWMHYFDKYINNLDFEYETRGFFKLVYLYMNAFDSSWMTWKRATLSSKIATPGLQYTVYIGLFIVGMEFFSKNSS